MSEGGDDQENAQLDLDELLTSMAWKDARASLKTGLLAALKDEGESRTGSDHGAGSPRTL